MIYWTARGDQIDALCQRLYGRTDGTVEAVLAGNLGLVQHLPIFPDGVRIEFPAPESIIRPVRAPVRLWGAPAEEALTLDESFLAQLNAREATPGLKLSQQGLISEWGLVGF